jgi:Gnt-I system low-affinity gluconate transporter
MGELLLAFGLAVFVLLFLILKLKIPAFISLLLASITAGLLSGLDPGAIIETIQKGMGNTLGFVATVVGLGAMFGAILEYSGGAQSIVNFLLKKFGEKRAPLAMMIAGFIIAIPVFFDVAFIILIPIIYSIQRKTKKSLLLYAIPLLAGLAITHSFIPPTPGPVAVADIINVDLGSVILIGLICGIPTAIVSGLFFGKYISTKIHIDAPIENNFEKSEEKDILPFGLIISIITLPIILILLGTFIKSGLFNLAEESSIRKIIELIGHPFVALIIANLLAWYFLGIRRKFTKDQLQEVSKKSFGPAGTIILLTGAGGVFKQVLVDTGAGTMIAESMSNIGFPILLFAFLAACLIRIIQGSATVAMITSAGLVAPLLNIQNTSSAYLACIVIAIASGASILSHVNDSGFWLVSQYLGMNEKDTFRSWTMMTTILALCGFTMAVVVSLFIG